MKIGSTVRLKVALLGNPVGTLGVAFNEYFLGSDGPSLQFIFANGEYDGFNPDEQAMYLEEVGMDESIAKDYVFSNVMQLSRDFEKGRFNSALLP